MHVKVLDCIVYDNDGWTWESRQTEDPTWQDIEGAVRRLNKFQYPLLYLWPTLDKSKHELTEGNERMTVSGGSGEYSVAASIDEFFERPVVNRDGGDHPVELWTSDQGYTTKDKYVLRNIDTVLHIVKYFCEHGGFCPTVAWDNQANRTIS